MTVPAPEGEIVVRHCSVEVVRNGGWSWGPDPDRLVRRVVDALPGLLAERFADQITAGADVEITEPVRLDVSAPLADLLAWLSWRRCPVPSRNGLRSCPRWTV